MKHHFKPPRMTARARDLRRGSTIPERILWSLLRGSRLGGLKFRRQYAIGGHVVDYYCHEKQLVVELDGESHVGRAVADEERSRELAAMGMRVVRFTNDDVLADSVAVAEAIARAAGVQV